jgi:hypothetical protein
MRLESGYPDQIRAGTAESAAVYDRNDEFVAVHGDPATMPAGALQLLEDETIGVFRAESLKSVSAGLRVGAVYSPAQKPSSFAVPTGRVLIRFQPGDSVAEHAAEIERAGYRIEEVLAYAPQAAWLFTDGGIAPALRQIDQLEAITNVQLVEPQLIRAAARRGDR